MLARTRGLFRKAWTDIAQKARDVVGAAPRPDLPEDDAQRLLIKMQDCIAARGGEVSARARAADLGAIYLGLEAKGRARFLRLVAENFACEAGSIEMAAEYWLDTKGKEAADRLAAEARLRASLEPPWRALLTQFNALPQGVKFLVDLRADLMALPDKDEPILAALDADLRALLGGWFDVGFLELRRIGWDAPAALLEKLIRYESVHAISSWTDLKNRLDSDRRCYAFFHPRMPDEPLIFVEVALVKGIADNVQALLDESAPAGDPASADTAIFYSISNCQRGLAGISFGGFLIKRVADQILRDLPKIDTFATLSPIPGFGAWLRRRMDSGLKLDPKEEKSLGEGGLAAALADPDWPGNEGKAFVLKPILLKLCAGYLLNSRHEGRAADRVAHFHLSNGARVERLNWLADLSPNGMRQSFGLMVNYRYKLEEIESNHEAYSGSGRVAATAALKGLVGR
ncbi:MAG: malonyl-CoA decarboxylase [Alphaproteobacteria bacterium]|nr:malonyl-CoA decarboxylase [Alphaproteobacteria bacterium]